MTNSKTKKPHLRKIAFAIIFLSIAAILTFIFVRLFEENMASQQQKIDLNESAKVMNEVVSQFTESITYEKSNQKQSSNSCTNVGAKYSTNYNCGNDFTFTLLKLDENQYLELNSKLVNIYKKNVNFSHIITSQPQYSDLSGMLSATVGSNFNNTDIKCHVASQYDSVNRIAKFDGGCNQVVKSLLFSKSN